MNIVLINADKKTRKRENAGKSAQPSWIKYVQPKQNKQTE